MTLTKKKTQQKQKSNERKFVLLRDASSEVLLIVDHESVSLTKTSKIRVGKEVTYVTSDRVRGRGAVLLIGKYVPSLLHFHALFLG